MSRRRVKGYTDFGGIQPPILQQYLILTDRDDGTLWYLSHSSDGTRLALNDGTISIPLKRVFAAFDEPFAKSNPRMRIFVRGGRLGYEIIELPQGEQDKDTMRLISRRADENVQRELISPADFSEANVSSKGVLAWEDSVV
jgi:hypothetical protein